MQTGKACIGDQRWAFRCKVIDNGHDSEPPSIGECLIDEVEAPSFAGP